MCGMLQARQGRYFDKVAMRSWFYTLLPMVLYESSTGLTRGFEGLHDNQWTWKRGTNVNRVLVPYLKIPANHFKMWINVILIIAFNWCLCRTYAHVGRLVNTSHDIHTTLSLNSILITLINRKLFCCGLLDTGSCGCCNSFYCRNQSGQQSHLNTSRSHASPKRRSVPLHH